MELKPTIQTIEDKQLVGMHLTMSLISNKTGELFSSFMPQRKLIPYLIDENTYDLKVYPDDYFEAFGPSTPFEKWALVEVSSTDNILEGMESYKLVGGMYAVFQHIGLMSDKSIYQNIYGKWLPYSGYQMDKRAHFDILTEKSKRNDPTSESEIWIPVKKLVKA